MIFPQHRNQQLEGCWNERKRTVAHDRKADLKDWITGQNSDGLGEGFEQQEINIESYSSSGRICVSFWHSDDDYFPVKKNPLRNNRLFLAVFI